MALVALVVVAPVFLPWMDVFGAPRYGHSLFGMGLDYLKIWDSGLLATARHLVQTPSSSSGLARVAAWFNTGVFAALLAIPLGVNAAAVGGLFRAWNGPAFRGRLEIAAFTATGVFMIFPFESRVILATKILFFLSGGFNPSARGSTEKSFGRWRSPWFPPPSWPGGVGGRRCAPRQAGGRRPCSGCRAFATKRGLPEDSPAGGRGDRSRGAPSLLRGRFHGGRAGGPFPRAWATVRRRRSWKCAPGFLTEAPREPS